MKQKKLLKRQIQMTFNLKDKRKINIFNSNLHNKLKRLKYKKKDNIKRIFKVNLSSN